MKHIKILTFSLLLASSFQAAADIKPLNGIAAEINASIITYGDVERAVRVLRSNPASKDMTNAQLAAAARQQLIERSLMVDAAKNQGFKVTESEIDRELQRRAAVANTTVAQLYAQAASFGWSKSGYRLNIAKDVLIERLMMSINESVSVNDAQIQAYIAQSQKEGKSLPTGSPFTVYEVRRILININDKNQSNAVGSRMKAIAQAMEQGASFESLAKRYSQDSAAGKGGLQEINEGSEPEKVEAMLKLLQAGQTSAPIQNANNWQMLQMVSKRTETDPAKIQHEAIRQALIKQERDKAYAQFIGQLQQNAVLNEY